LEGIELREIKLGRKKNIYNPTKIENEITQAKVFLTEIKMND